MASKLNNQKRKREEVLKPSKHYCMDIPLENKDLHNSNENNSQYSNYTTYDLSPSNNIEDMYESKTASDFLDQFVKSLMHEDDLPQTKSVSYISTNEIYVHPTNNFPYAPEDVNPSSTLNPLSTPESTCNVPFTANVQNSASDSLNLFFKNEVCFEDLTHDNESTCTAADRCDEPMPSNQIHLTSNEEFTFAEPSCEFASSKDLASESLPKSSNIETQHINRLFRSTTVYKQELMDLMFLSLKLYNGEYKIHLRQFKHDLNNNRLFPTKRGIVMDIPTWYDFYNKLYAFNLMYASASFIANNNIIVLNTNSEMHIKNMFNDYNIKLNIYQFENLKEFAGDLNTQLINHMFSKHLPRLIRQQCKIGNVYSEENHLLMAKLITCIEENLLTVFSHVYECGGCISNYPSKYHHPCLTFTNVEKYCQLGDDCIMLLNLPVIAYKFANVVNYISKQFLCTINAKRIRNILFKILK